MKQNKKIYILIITFFLFSISVFFVSAEERGLETQYPIIDGQEITTSTTIAEYAVYIFKFSMILAAIIAFAVLIYGGLRYVTSSGNPLAMDDAKKWILSAIIGLALILFSYIILNIINANFIKPDVQDIEPVGGILLIDENGVPRPFYSATEIPEDFNAVAIQFISPKPEKWLLDDINKEELVSIFYYSEIGFQGNVEKIENNKAPDSDGPSAKQGFSFPPRSILFFWQEAGVHLYQRANFDSPPVPKVCKSGTKNLGEEASDKIKSISLVDKGEDGETIWEEYYTAVVFEDTDYQGHCDLVVGPYNVVPRLQGKISSIAVAKGTEIYGEVIFYDAINCQGKEHIYKPGTLGNLRYGVVKIKDTPDIKQWLSLKINGNLSVLLNTEEDLKGRCAVFDQIGCTSDLKGTYIFSSDPKGFRPQEAYIFSSFK